jgi:hypothetical protein
MKQFWDLNGDEIQVEFFWITTPCSDVACHHRFGGLRCHIYGGSMALRNVGILPHQCTVSGWSGPWRWRQHDPPKLWYPTTSVHGVRMKWPLKMEAVWSSETLVSCHYKVPGWSGPWRLKKHDPPKPWYPTTTLHGVREKWPLKMEAAWPPTKLLHSVRVKFSLEMETEWPSETSVSYHNTTRCQGEVVL